jgi:GAF domain-containing protein
MAEHGPRTHLEELQFVQRVAGILRRTRADDHLTRITVREAVYALGASGARVARFDRFKRSLTPAERAGRMPDLPPETLLAFIDNRRPRIPPEYLLAPIRLGRRPIGVLAINRETPPFRGGSGRFLARLARALSDELLRREEDHLHAAFEREARKTLEGARPKDLLYRLLHDLRARLRYDHGARVLRLGRTRLTVVAEQVAHRAGVGRSIGRSVPLDDALRRFLEKPATRALAAGARRRGRAAALAALREPEAPEARLLVLRSLHHGKKPAGLLEVAASGGSPDAIDEWDRRVIETLAPLFAAALARSKPGERAARAQRRAPAGR